MLTEPIYTRSEVSDLEYLQTYSELQNKETAISNRSIALRLICLVLGATVAIGLIWFGAKLYFKF